MTNMKLAVCKGTPDIIDANVLRKYIHAARVRIVIGGGVGGVENSHCKGARP